MGIKRLTKDEIHTVADSILEKNLPYEEMVSEVASFGAVNIEEITDALVETPLFRKGKDPARRIANDACHRLLRAELDMQINPCEEHAVEIGIYMQKAHEGEKISPAASMRINTNLQHTYEDDRYFCAYMQGKWIGVDNDLTPFQKTLAYYYWKVAESQADPQNMEKAGLVEEALKEVNKSAQKVTQATREGYGTPKTIVEPVQKLEAPTALELKKRLGKRRKAVKPERRVKTIEKIRNRKGRKLGQRKNRPIKEEKHAPQKQSGFGKIIQELYSKPATVHSTAKTEPKMGAMPARKAPSKRMLPSPDVKVIKPDEHSIKTLLGQKKASKMTPDMMNEETTWGERFEKICMWLREKKHAADRDRVLEKRRENAQNDVEQDGM